MVREGSTNGRWAGRVEYICPYCGKVLLLTPNKAKKYEENKTACSRVCMGKKMRGIKKPPNPGAARHMREHNPMRRPEVAAKVSSVLKERYAAGELDHIRAVAREVGRSNLIAYNKSDACREKSSTRMIESNPMFSPDTAKKVSETRKAMFASGELTPYWLGKRKQDAVDRMSSDRNPMKDPDIRRETLRKAVATFRANGHSKGSRIVRNALEELGLNYVQEFEVSGPSRSFFLDFYLPDHQCAIEYDGHSRHYTPKGAEDDRTRDAWIMEHFGIRTIRVHRDTPFREFAALVDLIKTEVRS